ncbi:MAG: hypothetical protein ABIM59_00855 [candidate division WOR-3 bacterium]
MIDIIICVLVSQGLFAKRYGGADFDHAHSVVLADDGGYLVAGNTRSWGGGNYDILVFKTDPSGTLQWAKTFGGSESEQAYEVAKVSGGEYVICAENLVLRLDASGTLIEARRTPEIAFFSVEATSDGGYALAGYTASYGAGRTDFVILKEGPSGSWAKTFGGSGEESAWSIAQTSDRGFLVGGYTNTFGAGDCDFMILKLTSDGTLSWAKAFGGSGQDIVYSVGEAADGNYLFAGRTISFYPDTFEFLVAKMDPSGNILWTRICGRGGGWPAIGMIPTSDGGCAITSRRTPSGLFVAKLDASGNIEWARSGPGSDGWRGVIQTPDGGYTVAGYGFWGGANDALVLRVDPQGNYSGCVNDYAPATGTPSLITNPANGVLGECPVALTPLSLTVTSPNPSVADVCAPLEREESSPRSGATVISSAAPGAALFLCEDEAEIRIYSADGRLFYIGFLERGMNRVSLDRGVYFWIAGPCKGRITVR